MKITIELPSGNVYTGKLRQRWNGYFVQFPFHAEKIQKLEEDLGTSLESLAKDMPHAKGYFPEFDNIEDLFKFIQILETPVVEVTLEEIAEKFGVDVHNLKIKSNGI